MLTQRPFGRIHEHFEVLLCEPMDHVFSITEDLRFERQGCVESDLALNGEVVKRRSLFQNGCDPTCI